MGLNLYVAREVLRARSQARVRTVATIGQLQHFVLPRQARRLCTEFSMDHGAAWTQLQFGTYGNDFLSAAGVERVTVLDASRYEGADIIHDMNEPVALTLHNSFDVVIDGGSIEHIFRPDQALANVMRMVRLGGSAIIWTPANNLCGHGFYQFSPEFFFSAFTEATGFRIETALMVECVYPGVSLVEPRAAYRVRSPREARTRIGLVSRRPIMLLVRAVKVRHLPEPFARTPQQSDYEAQWETGLSLSSARLPEASGSRLANAARQRVRTTRVGGSAMRRILGIRDQRRFSLRNRSFFVPEDRPRHRGRRRS